MPQELLLASCFLVFCHSLEQYMLETGYRTALQASLQQLKQQEKGGESLLTWKQQSRCGTYSQKEKKSISPSHFVHFGESKISFLIATMSYSLYTWNNRIICNDAVIYYAASACCAPGICSALLLYFILQENIHLLSVWMSSDENKCLVLHLASITVARNSFHVYAAAVRPKER